MRIATIYLLSWGLSLGVPWPAWPLAASLQAPARDTIMRDTINVLPRGIRAVLDSRLGEWELAGVHVRQWRPEPPHSPVLIWGDFDGDGQQDYAAQVTYPREGGRSRAVMAFLLRGDSVKTHTLAEKSDDLWQTISLVPKGTVEYAYDRDERLVLENDGIFIGIDSKGGYTLVTEMTSSSHSTRVTEPRRGCGAL